MSWKMTWLPATLWVIAGNVAFAQTPGLPQGEGKGSPAIVASEKVDIQGSPNPALRATYEHIEIMRRLLTNKLEALYPSRSRELWNQGWNALPYSLWQGNLGDLQSLNPGSHTITTPQASYNLLNPGQPELNPNSILVTPNSGSVQNYDLFRNWLTVEQCRPFDVEGCYAEGHGVVYTVTLPPPHGKTRTKSVKPQPKPLSDWERARKQLHGEKEPDQVKQAPVQSQEQTLTDVILSALFENGHHFEHLAPNEKLTVVITFRSTQQSGPQVAEANKDNNPLPTSIPSTLEAAVAAVTRANSPAGASTESLATAPSTAHDYQLLGDLHLRQGQGKTAVDAYHRALELSPETGDSTLHQKLAQAYLSIGDLENARKEFDELDKRHKRQASKVDGAAKPDEPRLPAKLIIFAPKKLLEQAGAGKISLEEFKKGATIDNLSSAKLRAGQ